MANVSDFVQGELWGEKFLRGQEKAETKTIQEGFDYVACIHCGKVMKADDVLWLELGGGGDLLLTPETADQNDPGYMGCFAIGTTCGKNIPSEFLVKVGA